MMRTNPHMQDILLDNRYQIIEKIGVGGMADVYKGKDNLLGRTVAIKILHQNFASDEEFVTRFKREAQAAGRLNHPNIVNMYDVGYDQGFHYIVMEYVDGITLKQYITQQKRLPVDEAVKIAIAIGEGLEHAHSMGIVHCDIKPHNVMITTTGRVKVTDFGIARAMNANNTLMYTNSIMGTAHYLSPEQASGKPVDGSTDIYSLGVVLYEMLTGRVPFDGDTPISVALKHVREKLVPPTRYNQNVPALLESVVMKALAKNPEDRFASITDMIADLRLSQGFTMNHTTRKMPYDFATQVLPTVDDEDVYEELEEESKKKGILGYLASIPQKYIFIGAAALFLLAFLAAFLSFGNFWSNTEVTVPNVVGKQVSVAKHILEDNHLRVSTSEVTNPDVPAGQVISQTPSAGERVKEQRTIHLVVSKGVGDITVPDLEGLTVEQAKARLKDVGLVIGKITTTDDADKPDGVVITQSPSGNAKVSKGTTVDLMVNQLTQKQVAMPNLIGKTVKDARDILSALNLSLGQIAGSSDDNAIITEQGAGAGSSINTGTSVNVTAMMKNDSKPSKSSNVTSGTVDVTVPSGKQGQSLRIVVQDNSGSHVVYDGKNNPGDRVVKRISGEGDVRVQVYLNGSLVQDQPL